MLEVFFRAARDVLMEITLKTVETFQCIKSNRDFDVKIWKVFIYLHFKSWQTAVKSQGKPLRLRQSATIQKQKQSFFNFQENLNEGK
jgi:hypothetical protein